MNIEELYVYIGAILYKKRNMITRRIWSRINVPFITFLAFTVINITGNMFSSVSWMYGYFQGILGPVGWLIFIVKNSGSRFDIYLFSIFLLVTITCMGGIFSYVARSNIFTAIVSIISVGFWFYLGYLPAQW